MSCCVTGAAAGGGGGEADAVARGAAPQRGGWAAGASPDWLEGAPNQLWVLPLTRKSDQSGDSRASFVGVSSPTQAPCWNSRRRKRAPSTPETDGCDCMCVSRANAYLVNMTAAQYRMRLEAVSERNLQPFSSISVVPVWRWVYGRDICIAFEVVTSHVTTRMILVQRPPVLVTVQGRLVPTTGSTHLRMRQSFNDKVLIKYLPSMLHLCHDCHLVPVYHCTNLTASNLKVNDRTSVSTFQMAAGNLTVFSRRCRQRHRHQIRRRLVLFSPSLSLFTGTIPMELYPLGQPATNLELQRPAEKSGVLVSGTFGVEQDRDRTSQRARQMSIETLLPDIRWQPHCSHKVLQTLYANRTTWNRVPLCCLSLNDTTG
jgi:hypothetical protein